MSRAMMMQTSTIAASNSNQRPAAAGRGSISRPRPPVTSGVSRSCTCAPLTGSMLLVSPQRSSPERQLPPHLAARMYPPFVSLLRRIHACVNAGRWEVDDVTTAGEAVWSGVHGHTTLEHTGFFGAVGHDPARSYSEILTRMSIGFGHDGLATARSLSTARRRAVRADRAEAASGR